ncbi:hypothetical protein BN873_140029 [Candidatus Competibacter denitrificans Run_A_D11]|uniref:Uncharacterized protein n=1 Tax=Candidatus Competibacter denitrificans Run_A_D11 TaxID=1400863 RepID=W6M1D6_9GAMM|nr:hypothetical protein BN873_140029 [Candidatus Competibacter denitrificans Run_A_D11]
MLRLFDPNDIRFARKGRFDRLATMAVHHEAFGRVKAPGGAQDMSQQRFATYLVQNFGRIRNHPLPLAGGKDDDRKLLHH